MFSRANAANPTSPRLQQALAEFRARSGTSTALPRVINQELQRRTEFSLGAALRPNFDEGNLYEYFYLIGAPKDADPEKQKIYDPSVLYQYPEPCPDRKSPADTVDMRTLSHFCFPSLVKVEQVSMTESRSEINMIMFGSLQTLEESSRSFVFLITTEDTLLYGFCVRKLEFLSQRPTFVEELRDPSGDIDLSSTSPPKNFVRSRMAYKAERCYCLVSKFPYFDMHFKFLYGLIGHERLLEFQFAAPGGTTAAPSQDIMQAYYDVPVPNPSRFLEIPPMLSTFGLHHPEGDEYDQVVGWCLTSACRWYTLEDLLTIFKIALLERKMVFVSKNLGILSSFVMALTPLLQPFVYQGPFIPLLPSLLEECLDAPVPFIVGVEGIDGDTMERIKEEVAIVHIDMRTLRVPSSWNLPPLPNVKGLIKRIRPLHDLLYHPRPSSATSKAPKTPKAHRSGHRRTGSWWRYGGGSPRVERKPPKPTPSPLPTTHDHVLRPHHKTPQEEEAVHSIVQKVHAYNLLLIKEIAGVCRSQDINEIDTLDQLKLVRKHMPRRHAKFYQALFETQMFMWFADATLSGMLKRTEAEEMEALRKDLLENIAQEERQLSQARSMMKMYAEMKEETTQSMESSLKATACAIERKLRTMNQALCELETQSESIRERSVAFDDEDEDEDEDEDVSGPMKGSSLKKVTVPPLQIDDKAMHGDGSREAVDMRAMGKSALSRSSPSVFHGLGSGGKKGHSNGKDESSSTKPSAPPKLCIIPSTPRHEEGNGDGGDDPHSNGMDVKHGGDGEDGRAEPLQVAAGGDGGEEGKEQTPDDSLMVESDGDVDEMGKSTKESGGKKGKDSSKRTRSKSAKDKKNSRVRSSKRSSSTVKKRHAKEHSRAKEEVVKPPLGGDGDVDVDDEDESSRPAKERHQSSKRRERRRSKKEKRKQKHPHEPSEVEKHEEAPSSQKEEHEGDGDDGDGAK